MIASVVLFVAAAAFLMLPTPSADDPPGPGVPLTLAEDRARRVSNLRYELHVGVPEAQAEPLHGTMTIRFTLKDASRSLAMDFAPPDGIRSSKIAGRPATLEKVSDHLIIPVSGLRE